VSSRIGLTLFLSLNKTPTSPEILEALRNDVEESTDEESLMLWFYPEGPLKLDLTSLLISIAEWSGLAWFDLTPITVTTITITNHNLIINKYKQINKLYNLLNKKGEMNRVMTTIVLWWLALNNQKQGIMIQKAKNKRRQREEKKPSSSLMS